MLNRLLLAALVVCLPLAALAYAKPTLIVKAVTGASCAEEVICTDDPTRSNEAKQLYEQALSFLAASVGPLTKRPLVVFCASQACYQSFGFTQATARSVGGFSIVIGPNGWKPYYVQHEMIHRLQWQELGVFRMYMEPQWFIEGMAYSLSKDPRPTLAEPFQGYRSDFQAWYRRVGKDRLWLEAANL